MIWFIADTHFGHKNIIKYCERPFSSVEEMDETMIKNWNNHVSREDTVYHLGDFACGCSTEHAHNILRQLNGNICLIRGNHDKVVKSLHGEFGFVKDYYELKHKPHHICLFHYALRTWRSKGRGSFHLYGHSHGKMPSMGRSCDVGVDVWDFKPVSIDKIVKSLSLKEFGYSK